MTDRVSSEITKSQGTYSCGLYHYVVSVIGPAILILGLFIVILFRVASGHPTKLEQTGLVVLPIMLFFTVLSANQPFAYIIDDEKIRIKSYWRTIDYNWKDLSSLKVKEFSFVDRVYIRIGAGRILSGRYWLDVHLVSNGKKLMTLFKIIEGTLHPDRIMYQRVDRGAKNTLR